MKPQSRTFLMQDYRNPLRALAVLALVAGVCLPTVAFGQENNQDMPVIPLKITNNFSTREPLFVYIWGQLTSQSATYPQGTWVYVTDTKGDVTITPPIPVDSPISLGVDVGSGKDIDMMLPEMTAIRIYLSISNDVVVQTNNTAGSPPSAPCGWCGEGNKENKHNFNTIYEWAELAWTPNPGNPAGHKSTLGGNVTEVDLFSLPLKIAFTGNDPTIIAPPTPVTRFAGFDQTRAAMLNAYSALGPEWTPLVLSNASGPLRVVAPYHGMQLGIFDATAFTSFIDKVWNSGTPIRASAVCHQDGNKTHNYVGHGSGSEITFSENGVEKFSFKKPSAFTVYTNEIHASPEPLDALTKCLSEVVAAKLGGAIIRTVVLVNPNLDDCMVDQFYKANPAQKYAEFFHKFGINNLAYAYGYDDTCSQSSYITVDDPKEVRITIGAK